MSNSSSKQKLSCPFCGDRDVRAHHRGHATAGEWVIECHSCSCELTGFASEQDAWKTWNGRWNQTPDETTASRPFYQLLDDYFNALVRGGRQTQIDEARLAIIREYERVSGLSAVHGTPLHQALGSPLEPTRCIDCGVSLVPEARHFSGCKSHPGERAVKARAPLRDSDAAFNLGVLPTEQPEKSDETK